jgi:flagellar protein FliO/FliZ
MQWLNELFGDNRVVQIAVLAACGIAVLVALAFIYRVVFAHRLRVPGGRTRQPRLGLVDAFSLDGQRQLVLIRRDNIEHLVMIGGPNDVLVESQINRALAPARETALTPAAQAPKRTDSAAGQPAAPVQPAAPIPASAAASAVPAPPPTAKVTPARGPMPPAQPSPGAASLPPAKAAEAHRASPAAQPQSRSAAPRPSMPPPIAAQSAPAARSASAVPANAHPPTATPAQSHPGAAKPVVTQHAPDALDAIAKAVGATSPSTSAPAQTEPAVGQPLQTKPQAKPEAPAAGPEPKVEPPTPTKAAVFPSPISAERGHKAENRPEPKVDLAAKTPAPGVSKPASAVETPPAAKTAQRDEEDPFAGLGSLEAEMARLLGRKS